MARGWGLRPSSNVSECQTSGSFIMGLCAPPLVCELPSVAAWEYCRLECARIMASLLESVKDFFNAGLGLVYPEWCQVCRQRPATKADGFICAECRGAVHFIEAPFCSRCGLPFEGQITQSF